MTKGAAGAARPRPPRARLYGLLGLMVFFWSANFVVAKIALREFPPLLLSAIRTTLAGLLILPVYFWHRGRRESGGEIRRDLGRLTLLGIVGVAANQLCFVFGLSRTSVAHSAILMGLTPMVVLLMAALAGHERVSRWKLGGMAAALAGVAVLNLAPVRSGGASLLGDTFTILASLTFAWFSVYGKEVTVRHGAVAVNTVAYVGAALVLSPLTLVLAARHSLGGISVMAWVSLFYMALFPSMVCYLIYAYALEHIPASRVASASYVQPLLATLIAVPVLGESLGLGVVAGGALVFSGVWIAGRTP